MRKISKVLTMILMCMFLISKNVQADVIEPGQVIIQDIKNIEAHEVVICVAVAMIVAVTAIIVIKLINKSKKK